MNRRQSFKWLLGLSVTPWFNAAFAREGGFPLNKTNKEWSALLPPAAYRVLFEEDTERSGSSPLNAEKRDGTFICAACNLPLFDSTKKYESGTGWPSFWEPLPGGVATKTDFKLIYPRTEYHCSRCGGHQGHVFTDGPQPSLWRELTNCLRCESDIRHSCGGGDDEYSVCSWLN